MHATARSSSEYTIADQDRMRLAPRYFEWQWRMAREELGRRVLEVGCGVGNFSGHLADRELVVGVDIDETCVRRWRERFAGRAHYHGVALDAADPDFCRLRRHRVDSIACLNVLEHIEHHEIALRNMHSILPREGRVVLIVPAFESLYGEIDARLGHHRRYTRKTLRRVAEAAGFYPRRLRFMNAAGFFGWWANAKIARRSEQSARQIRFFDSRIVPLISRLERWAPPPFGQSIVATLEKR